MVITEYNMSREEFEKTLYVVSILNSMIRINNLRRVRFGHINTIGYYHVMFKEDYGYVLGHRVSDSECFVSSQFDDMFKFLQFAFYKLKGDNDEYTKHYRVSA